MPPPLKSMLLHAMDIRQRSVCMQICLYYTAAPIPGQNNIDFRAGVQLMSYLIQNVTFFLKIPNIMTTIVWRQKKSTFFVLPIHMFLVFVTSHVHHVSIVRARSNTVQHCEIPRNEMSDVDSGYYEWYIMTFNWVYFSRFYVKIRA